MRQPLVITWQSVVDSTVGANGAADTLYGRLHGPAHRLVMLDVLSLSYPGPRVAANGSKP